MTKLEKAIIETQAIRDAIINIKLAKGESKNEMVERLERLQTLLCSVDIDAIKIELQKAHAGNRS